MKILYGVQGTGNGHISRASAMFEAFKQYPDLEIDWLLSGRDKARGCGAIENFLWREGLTFIASAGKISALQTLKKNNLWQFYQDVRNLDLSSYDMVISDFEPVISHAARKQNIPLTGIGHQYAFKYPIPKSGANPLVNFIMNSYAPVSNPVGLHWHHFNAPILPPILDIELPELMPAPRDSKVIIYLPFENIQQILEILRPLTNHEFYIYHPDFDSDLDEGHLHCRAISRAGFKQDLLDAQQVISNSGFELISECLQIGKNILSKPLQGQMEQLSNAKALEVLGYAEVMYKLDKAHISAWLEKTKSPVQVTYPNVAARLAEWIAGGCKENTETLADELWQSPPGTASFASDRVQSSAS